MARRGELVTNAAPQDRYAPSDGLEPMPDYDDAADDAYEAAIAFHRGVTAELQKLKIRQAAKDALRAEQVGEITIPELVRLDDFLARPIDPITHRIDGLWPIGGRVVLAAQWKAGKTTLRDNVIRSLVDGHTFLGVHHVAPLPGPVILLDFELDEQTLQRWLADQGYKHPERVHVISMKGRVSTFNILDEKLRARWVETLAVAGPATIIIDCLRPILDALGLDENREVGRFLGPLDELVAACGAREILLVHHMGHGSERSRGDSRLRDWPDAEWRLVRDKDDDDPTMDNPAGPRYFSAYGRDVDHPQTELTYDPQTRHLTIGADAGTRKASGERRIQTKVMDAILSVVTNQPGINKRALRAACSEHGGWRGSAIDAAAEHLQTEGRIRVVKVGQTHLHYPDNTNRVPRVPRVPDTADTVMSGDLRSSPGHAPFTPPEKPSENPDTDTVPLPFNPATGANPPAPTICAICNTRKTLPGRGICNNCADLPTIHALTPPTTITKTTKG
jgi:AAA domain